MINLKQSIGETEKVPARVACQLETSFFCCVRMAEALAVLEMLYLFMNTTRNANKGKVPKYHPRIISKADQYKLRNEGIAMDFYKSVNSTFGFVIPSMQSIWYGVTQKIFSSEDDRKHLIEYTKRAILFAEGIGCNNLVFGCPRNRAIPEDADPTIAIRFFQELGDYAFQHHTVIGLEANPPIYHTNYINTTSEALNLIRAVDVFMTYELLAYLSVRATQIGMKACEIPVTRVYPQKGKTPTKISFFKGNSDLMRILIKNMFGAYKPSKEPIK